MRLLATSMVSALPPPVRRSPPTVAFTFELRMKPIDTFGEDGRRSSPQLFPAIASQPPLRPLLAAIPTPPLMRNAPKPLLPTAPKMVASLPWCCTLPEYPPPPPPPPPPAAGGKDGRLSVLVRSQSTAVVVDADLDADADALRNSASFSLISVARTAAFAEATARPAAISASDVRPSLARVVARQRRAAWWLGAMASTESRRAREGEGATAAPVNDARKTLFSGLATASAVLLAAGSSGYVTGLSMPTIRTSSVTQLAELGEGSPPCSTAVSRALAGPEVRRQC